MPIITFGTSFATSCADDEYAALFAGGISTVNGITADEVVPDHVAVGDADTTYCFLVRDGGHSLGRTTFLHT